MDLNFYAATAQILPVLFLAAAVEFRLLVATAKDVESWGEDARAATVATYLTVIVGFVLTVGLGEAAALRVLAEKQTLLGADELIIASLGASAAALLLGPVINLGEAMSDVLSKEANAAESKAEADVDDSKPEARTAAVAKRKTAVRWDNLVTTLSLLAVVTTAATPVLGVWFAAVKVLS